MLLSYETEFQKLDGEKMVWLFRVCLLSCQFNVSEWSDSIRLHHISGETCDNGKHAYALFPSHSSFNLQIPGDFRRICLQNLKGKQNKRRGKSVVNQQKCSFRQINVCFGVLVNWRLNSFHNWNFNCFYIANVDIFNNVPIEILKNIKDSIEKGSIQTKKKSERVFEAGMGGSLISSICTTNRTFASGIQIDHMISIFPFRVREIQMAVGILRHFNAPQRHRWCWGMNNSEKKQVQRIALNWFHFSWLENISNLSHEIQCQSNRTDNKSTWKHNALSFQYFRLSIWLFSHSGFFPSQNHVARAILATHLCSTYFPVVLREHSEKKKRVEK